MKSSISGFYKLTPEERLKTVSEFADLDESEKKALSNVGLDTDQANRMIENVIGTIEIPLGIATNFLVNGSDRLVPMAIEEASVVAAASNAAKIARKLGGFSSNLSQPRMIGQIQVCQVKDMDKAKKTLIKSKNEILGLANTVDPMLVSLGGGAVDIEMMELKTIEGDMLILHLIVDCRDAMGANAVNTMVEAVSSLIEKLTGGKVYLRIISNLAVYRYAECEAIFPREVIGSKGVDGIMKAYAFAVADPFRCATHNKGIMNGVSAVVLATGNDTRAIEAGAHTFSSYKGQIRPLTTFQRDENGDLRGSIKIPVPVGIVGGATAVHPGAKACLKILGVKSSEELGEILAAVGLAQNFAALYALSTVGIQKGHMKLHARNIAVMAGASPDQVQKVADRLNKEKKIRLDRAKEIIKDLNSG